MGPQTTLYGVEAANRVLPAVRRLVHRIVSASEALPELEDGVRIARYRARRPAAEPEARVEADRRQAVFEGAQRDIVAALRALCELGVVLKDPRAGLVDFYSERGGEVVELCWKLGEERVEHWHRIGEGFHGRRPL